MCYTTTHRCIHTYVCEHAYIQRKWPRMFGANGSMRFKKAIGQEIHADCRQALELVERIRDECGKEISYADLFQLGAVVAVKV
jgi:catalase (peroxidase I)